VWNADVGDPRFIKKDDMEARFALVVGSCLATSCAMAGTSLFSGFGRLIVEVSNAGIVEGFFERLMKPDVLKKIYGLKDTFVYRHFFRLLTLITKSFKCIPPTPSQLICSIGSSTYE
jgi:hypothetical protein